MRGGIFGPPTRISRNTLNIGINNNQMNNIVQTKGKPKHSTQTQTENNIFNVLTLFRMGGGAYLPPLVEYRGIL